MSDPNDFDDQDSLIADEIADRVYEKVKREIGNSVLKVFLWVLRIGLGAIIVWGLTWFGAHVKLDAR